VARATGKKSDHGARLDVLVDYAVHCSVILALLTVVAGAIQLPVAVLVLPSTLWFVGTFTGVLRRSATDNQSLINGRKILADIIKMAGDNGATMFVLGGWLLVHPRTVFVPVAAFTLANLVLLARSIWRDARRSMQAVGRHGSPGNNPQGDLLSGRADGT
jgi:phosphatidylglycerophosphate synthase